METFSSVSVACRVMSYECSVREQRPIAGGPPFTRSKPVFRCLGGSHIFCCHSSDVTRKLQKCFDVMIKKKHPKTKSSFSHLIFHYIVTGIKSDRDMAVIFQFNWQWKRHFKKLLSQQAESVYSQRKEIYWNCVVHLILTKHEEKLWLRLKFHLLIYSFEIVKIHGRLMNNSLCRFITHYSFKCPFFQVAYQSIM